MFNLNTENGNFYFRCFTHLLQNHGEKNGKLFHQNNALEPVVNENRSQRIFFIPIFNAVRVFFKRKLHTINRLFHLK